MSMFGAVADTCVLFPAPIRDTLLRAAKEGLYRIHWTNDILAELEKNLITHRGLTIKQVQGLVEAMNAAFPEAIVAHYEDLIDAMTNDPKDRHVLAAAVASSAQVIITDNLRDFPEEALMGFNSEAQSADVFLTHLFDLAPERMAQILINQAGDLHKPAVTLQELLVKIEKHAPVFVQLIRKQIEVTDFIVRRLKIDPNRIDTHQRVRIYGKVIPRK